MPNETAHLALADRHIVEAEERIARQLEIIAELARDGHSTATAEALLTTFRATLTGMKAHRLSILDEIERQKRGL